ncbi:MAG TPA: SDR family oxidoreductase [Spirochaetia bacterium]|nr:SDR family oxidoreductase [Spirochaetia bacterium]
MEQLLAKYEKLFDLTGSTALVAGGAGGIGQAVSEGFAAYGCTVVLTSRTAEKAEKIAGRIRDAGGKAYGVALSADSMEAVRRTVEGVRADQGRIDILVNCIGSHIEAPAEDYREEDWDKIFNGSVKTAFFLSQAVAKGQIGHGGGRHIHVSSVRSQLGLQGRGYVSYCSSRGAMNMMIRQLASEWAKHHINVNGIAPTFTRTDLVAKYLNDPAFYNPLIARIPLGRVADPIDLAGLAIYLAAPASSFITGQIVFADGGVTACQ